MIIGLSGKARVGKDTVGEYITQEYPGIIMTAFAKSLKRTVQEAFGFSGEQIWDDKKLEVDPYWGISPVVALQIVGTDFFRYQFDEDFWVKRLFRTIEQQPWYRHWVITDVRFPNEVEAIKDRDGIVIRLEREVTEDTGRPKNHPSEIALDDYKGFDYIVENNGTKKELFSKIDNIIHEIRDGAEVV